MLIAHNERTLHSLSSDSSATAAGCICVNEEFFLPSDARVSVLDHGFLYGDGLFETLRTYGGLPFRLGEHLARLEHGLKMLEFAGAPTVEKLDGLVKQTLTRANLTEAYIRITVTRGIGRHGLDPAGCDAPTVLVAALPLRSHSQTLYETGVSATILWPRPATAFPPPTLKTTSFQHTVAARLEIARRRAFEGLYVDASDNVTEGTISNVFAVIGQTLLTPPVTVCLPGITRGEVIALAKTAGMHAVETALARDLLCAADEIFLTSSLAEVLPVTRVDDREIGGGAPGRVTGQLHRRYRQLAGATVL